MKFNYHIKLSERNKIIVLFCFLVLIISLLIFFVILPSAREIKEVKAEIKNQREEMEKKYLSGINARILSQKAPKVKEKMAEVEKIFIKSEEQLEFVTSLEKIAEDNQVEQTPNIEYGSSKNNDFYKVIPLRISTEGALANQLNYIRDLKSLRYYINIQSIKMKKNINNSGSLEEEVSLFIKAQSYWEK